MKLFPLLLAGLLLSACSGNEDELGSGERQNTNASRQAKVQNTHFKRDTHQSIWNNSQHLAKTARQIPKVQGAEAVAIGRYAIVGIDVDSHLERSDVGSLKYSVAEALKNEPYGADAIVVADPDIYARLQELGQDIRAGEPINGVANELADIAGRLLPELPGNLVAPQEPQQAPEQQKRSLNKKEQQQLEQEQEDQSNHMK